MLTLGSKRFRKYESEKEGKTCMKILTMTVIFGLPLMALGQNTEPQQTTTQGQTNQTQTTAPAKGKKTSAQEPAKAQARPDAATNMRGQTNMNGRSKGV